MYRKQHFAENYKKMYGIWRRRNRNSRMYLHAKKILNQKNYIMKHKKLTEIKIKEIKREIQVGDGTSLEERDEEQ